MPLAKRTRRRRPFKVRRRIRVKRAVSAPLTHTFTRKCAYTSQVITAGAGAGTAFACLVFRLNDLPDYTDFTTLYDQFRINWVKVRVENRYNAIAGGTAAGAATQLGMPRFIYAIDNDDANTPTSFDQLRQVQRSKEGLMSPNKNYFQVKLRPRPVGEVYTTLLTTGYVTMGRSPFIDVNYYNVPHFGLKFGLQVPFNGSLPYDVPFDIRCTMSITCKDPR